MNRLDLSPTGRGRVVAASVLATLGCVILSFTVNSLGLTSTDQSNWPVRIFVSVFIPIVVAFPTMWFLMSKLRELAIAHQRLQVIAATDSLTAVLNRGAFTMLVDAYLTRVQAHEANRGALLVVDADNFKAINDRYGHDSGDEALKIIASSIKAVLRSPDLVGRIGGEEFGVFLPGSSPEQAETVAERIRASVDVIEFRPLGGERRALSVSVGGATFERPLEFRELFKAADRRLYAAKQAGRNRVFIAPAEGFSAAA